jgi:hypothetical protein
VHPGACHRPLPQRHRRAGIRRGRGHRRCTRAGAHRARLPGACRGYCGTGPCDRGLHAEARPGPSQAAARAGQPGRARGADRCAPRGIQGPLHRRLREAGRQWARVQQRPRIDHSAEARAGVFTAGWADGKPGIYPAGKRRARAAPAHTDDSSPGRAGRPVGMLGNEAKRPPRSSCLPRRRWQRQRPAAFLRRSPVECWGTPAQGPVVRFASWPTNWCLGAELVAAAHWEPSLGSGART